MTRRGRRVTAVSDRCVHRRFPLSQPPSRLVDDQVVCGYHGFTYGADGRCVSVPGRAASRAPPSCCHIRWPEQDSFVWIFTGDPAKPARYRYSGRSI